MSDSRDDFIIAVRYALLKKGAKQKFSLFFLILLSISTITLDKLSFTVIQSTRSILNDFVYQVAVVTSTPGKLINNLAQVTKNHFAVYDQNRVLREKLRVYRNQSFNTYFLQTENTSLKKTLGLRNDRYIKKVFSISAKVIFDQKSPFLKSLLINKGKKDKIIKGMAVFSNNYLIGTVIEANYLTARVLLITDLNSKIPVIVQSSDANGVLTGSGQKDELLLEYLPEKFILELEKIIFTSGKAGFLEAGIPVAETYLNKKGVIQVRALADPQQAMIVIITSGQATK